MAMRASICGEYVFSELGALCAFARDIFSFFVVRALRDTQSSALVTQYWIADG